MKILYLNRFARQFKKLPVEIQYIAAKKEKIFRKDPFCKTLKTHKLHGKLNGFWVFSIGYDKRIIFEFINEKTVLFCLVGNHKVYD